MKKVLFLLFTCLLLVALVIPACKGGGPRREHDKNRRHRADAIYTGQAQLVGR